MTVNCTLERIRANDGVELCGVLAAPPHPTHRGLIHIHGLSGNFYEQKFIDNILQTGVESSYMTLVCNNRGHDYFSDAIIRHSDHKESLPRGGAHERIDEALIDIEAKVDFLISRGITSIVLTAHSTGAVKAALSLSGRPKLEVKSAVFISPSDDVGIQRANAGGDFDNLLNHAENLVAQGNPDKLMPEDAFFYPIDAQAYVDLFNPESVGNVFDLTSPGASLSSLSSIAVPVLIILGSDDIAVVSDDKDEAAQHIIRSMPQSDGHRYRVIEGADHDYFGHESDLANEIKRWLTT